MRKLYKKLTADQIKRNVVFSSCLSKFTVEQLDDNIHEIFKTADIKDQQETKRRLLDDKFFNGSSWKYNIIRG